MLHLSQQLATLALQQLIVDRRELDAHEIRRIAVRAAAMSWDFVYGSVNTLAEGQRRARGKGTFDS
jgi:hypothetical protein